MFDRFGLSGRERLAASAVLYLLPVVLALLVIALVRDMWPPFRQVAVMFFLGWLLAFLLDPIVDWLVDHLPWLPRGIAAALTFVLVAGITMLAAALVALSFVESVADVLEGGPSLDDALTDLLASVESLALSLGLDLDIPGLIDDAVATLQTHIDDLFATAIGGGLAVLTLGTTIIFIAVVMVANKASFTAFTRRLVPSDRLGLFDAVSHAVDRSFGGFIRGQFGLAILYGVFVSIIALVFGIPFLPFIGVTTALLQSIPFFGQLVSWIPLVLVTFAFRPDQLIPVGAIMAVGWLLMQNVLAPRVMGSAVGLNPLVVLAAVFVGGAVAGPLGAVFGVPIVAAFASVFVAWLDHVHPEEELPPAAATVDVGHPEGAKPHRARR